MNGGDLHEPATRPPCGRRGWSPHVHDVQPGGGLLVWLRHRFGVVRRALLRRFRRRYVAAMQARFSGVCESCPHDLVDGRDLLWVQNVCGRRLPPEHTIPPFRDRLGLARLGRPELVAAAIASVLLLAVAWWWPMCVPLALVPLAFALWFFRDPERAPPADDTLLLAPADGVVDDLREESAGPFFAEPALRIGIYLSLFDVHVQRAPCAAVVTRCEHRPGRRVPTVRVGVTDANEQLLTWFRRDDGLGLGVRQVAGPLARRVCSVLGAGDEVAAGQRFGLIKFGSRCELWVPLAAGGERWLAIGQRVRAGETALLRVARRSC